MSSEEAIKACFRKFFVFWLTAKRSEFWQYWLFATVFAMVSVSLNEAIWRWPETLRMTIGYSFIAANIIVQIPLLAVTARRINDVGIFAWGTLFTSGAVAFYLVRFAAYNDPPTPLFFFLAGLLVILAWPSRNAQKLAIPLHEVQQ
jgi:uncharacterized membrane protein YhaH (DUF805 family)